MKLLSDDLYINCENLIEQANILYYIVKIKDILPKEDVYYIEDMHRYINKYKLFKERQVKQYITDLNGYINNENKA